MDVDAGGKKGTDGVGGEETGSGTTAVVKKRNRLTWSSAPAQLMNQNQTLPFEVFNNHLLREKIVEFLILDAGCEQEANRKTAASLRLVNKTWNETVIKLLHKNERPFSCLSIEEERDGEKLARFYKTFDSSAEVNGCIPPIRLDIHQLEPEIVNELSNLLSHCGAGLAQLCISMKADGHQYENEFPNWSLDRLRKLQVVLLMLRQSSVGSEGDGTFGKDGHQTLGSCLLKSLLSQSKSLICLKMVLLFGDTLPPGVPRSNTSIFESVTLPPAVTNLTVIGYPTKLDLEILSIKPLPHLSSLEFHCSQSIFVDGLLFRILNNFRATLKTLLIYGDIYLGGGPRHVDLVRFPPMSQLEQLNVSAFTLELDSSGVLLSLQSLFPKLLTFRMYCQTESMLHKWIGNSKYISVTSLQFYLADENFDQGEFHNFIKGLNMETMQTVNLAFPNLRELELCLSGRDTSGLEYVFKEMTQLTDLKICYYKQAPEVDSGFWDVVLTGLPLKTVARLRNSSELWDRSEVMRERVAVSIINLKELARLSLSQNRPNNVEPLYVSDLTFRVALLQLPKLKNLCLCGQFKMPAEMTQEWRNRGRVLQYS